MNGNAWIWWVLGALVLLAIIWFVTQSMGKSRADAHRQEAQSIREESVEQEREMRAREAAAAESEAAARRAQAEADEQAAKAEQLRVEAEQRAEHAGAARGDYEERMREADRIDPDVETDKHGNRLGGAAAAVGVGAAGTGAVLGDRDGDGVPNALDPNDGGATGGWGDRDDDRVIEDASREDPSRHREGALGDRDSDRVPNALDPNDGGATGGWGDRDDDAVLEDASRDDDHDDRSLLERAKDKLTGDSDGDGVPDRADGYPDDRRV